MADELTTVTVEDLQRWEDAGAVWDVRQLEGDAALIELKECTGQLVELVRAASPEVVEHVRRRLGGGSG